jgi:hypothetical protein
LAAVHARAYNPLDHDFEAERIKILGNFIETLEECHALLERNKHLRDRYSNVWENLQWHLTQQEQRINDLRQRLHFHSEKIRLVIDRLSIKLLTDLDSKLDSIYAVASENLIVSHDILHEVRNLRHDLSIPLDNAVETLGSGDSPIISSAVAQRFEEAFSINAPSDIGMGLPLAEAFDALYTRFEQCAVGDEQTPEKYLHCLQCRWLLDRIKSSAEYNRAAPAFYYQYAINRIDLTIRRHMQQSAKPYADSTLLDLPSHIFEVWPAPSLAASDAPSQPHPLSSRGNEEKIMRTELLAEGNRSPDVVTVFKHGDENYRIVLEGAGLTGERIIQTQQVYTKEDRLIPRYALPTLPNAARELAIFSRNELTFYLFSTDQDLWKFQTALTGYDVSHDQDSVQFQFSDNVAFLDCSGRIQLWQDPIILRDDVEAISKRRESAYSDTSLHSSGLQSQHLSLAPSIARTTAYTITAEGVQMDNIRHAAAVIFTQLRDRRGNVRFATMFFELGGGLHVDPAQCKCKDDYNTCSKLVLIRARKKNVTIKVQYSELDAASDPNPNTFDILPFRLPRSSSFWQTNSFETEYVVMKFKNLSAKELFHRELNYRFSVQRKQQADQDLAIRGARIAQDRPLRNGQPKSQVPSRTPSTSGPPPAATVSRVMTLPPQIEEPDHGPNFQKSMTPSIDMQPRVQRHGSHSTMLSSSPQAYSNSTRSRSTGTDASRGELERVEEGQSVSPVLSSPPNRSVLPKFSTNVATHCDGVDRQATRRIEGSHTPIAVRTRQDSNTGSIGPSPISHSNRIDTFVGSASPASAKRSNTTDTVQTQERVSRAPKTKWYKRL